MKKLVSTIFILLWLINAANILYSQELTPKEIFKKCEGAVVVVIALDKYNNKLGFGSGVIINEKGWIVTNYHVYKNEIYNASKLSIKHDDINIEYTDIIGFDIQRDLLFLKFDNNKYNLTNIKIGNSDKLEVGDPLYSIGSPQGLENSLYPGLVSGLNREIPWSKYPAIQMSCIIDHGSSGGAVVNAYGELVGISTWGTGNLFFAIPSNDIFKVYISSYGDKEGEKYINYFDLGYKADDEKRYEDAIYYYSKYLEKYPKNADAYNNRGNAYNYLQKYDEAIADLNKAIKLKPDLAEAYNNRGNAYYFLHKYDKAIADYNKAIQLKPDLAEAYNNRGVAYDDLKKYAEAIADYTKAIELKPDYADAYYNRGIVYKKLQKYAEAIADYTKAIELKPDYADAYNNRGNVYYNLQKYAEAIADYTKAIELKPDDAEAYYNRGNAYKKSGNMKKACEDWRRAYSLGDTDAKELLDKYCK